MLIKQYQCIVKHHRVCAEFDPRFSDMILFVFVEGAQNLIELRLVDTLLKKLISELDEIKVSISIEKQRQEFLVVIVF